MNNLKMVSFGLCLMLLAMMAMPAAAWGQAGSVKSTQADTAAKAVNINTAAAAELTTLPRIGEKMAQRIISFRKGNGPFKRKEDLMKVKGIGEKLFRLIEKRITI